MAITLDEMYGFCDVLDKASDGESADLYLKILSGTKGDTNEKRLAGQLIVRYFHKFPDHNEAAIDGIFELCEDDDVNTRKQVVKDLPALFKKTGPHVTKIADVLVQLLQAQDAQENHIVQTALTSVMKTHAKEVLNTLFLHISSADEDLLRERALRFLALKLRTLSDDILTKDLENYIIEESKKLSQLQTVQGRQQLLDIVTEQALFQVMTDVTGDEFIILMNLLSQLSQLQTVQGRQQLLDIVTEQALFQVMTDVTGDEFIILMNLLSQLSQLQTVQGRQQLLDIVTEQALFQVMTDVTGDEFIILMNLLSQLSQLQTVQGRQQLLDIVTEQALFQVMTDVTGDEFIILMNLLSQLSQLQTVQGRQQLLDIVTEQALFQVMTDVTGDEFIILMNLLSQLSQLQTVQGRQQLLDIVTEQALFQVMTDVTGDEFIILMNLLSQLSQLQTVQGRQQLLDIVTEQALFQVMTDVTGDEFIILMNLLSQLSQLQTVQGRQQLLDIVTEQALFQVMTDVTGDEFIILMNLLSQLSQLQTVQGRQQLLDIVTEQALFQVMTDVTGDEFIILMNLLSQLSQLQTVQGRQQLLDIVTEQALFQVMTDVTGDEFIILMNLLSQLSQLQTVQGRQQLLDIVTEQALFQVMTDVTGDEFIILMNLLSQLSQLQTVQGRQQLLDIVTEQAELNKPFDPKDADRVDQIIQCTKQAIPYLSKNVPSTPFLQFIFDHVYSQLATVSESVGDSQKLTLMRLTAELATHPGTLTDLDRCITAVFDQLMTYMPLPPSEDEAASSTTENGDASTESEPKLAFSELECLMWTLHQLGRKQSEFFTAEVRAEKMKEFKRRLQYVARVIQVYSKKLRGILQGKTKEELGSEENKLKVLAMRTTHNINVIVKDLLHIPPQLKNSIQPSWKPLESRASPGKRESSSSLDSDRPNVKRAHRPEVSRYTAPGGKYSDKIDKYKGWEDEETGANYGGGGYGNNYGWRGRGRGRRGRGRRFSYY